MHSKVMGMVVGQSYGALAGDDDRVVDWEFIHHIISWARPMPVAPIADHQIQPRWLGGWRRAFSIPWIGNGLWLSTRV